jgi:hypothetical protein
MNQDVARVHAGMLAEATRPRNLHRVLVPALKYLTVAAFGPGILAGISCACFKMGTYDSALICE